MSDLQPFSASSLQTFLRCAKQWEYAYVYEFKRPPSLRMIIGTSAHAAEEVNYKQKIETGEDISLEHAVDLFSTAFDSAVAEAESQPEDDAPLRSLAEVEEAHILRVLDRCGGSQVEAARVLGIGRNTLWRKLRRLQAP